MKRKVIAFLLCVSVGVASVKTAGTYIFASEINTDATSEENIAMQSIVGEITGEDADTESVNSDDWQPSIAETGYLDIGERVSSYTPLNSVLLRNRNLPASYNADIANLSYISPVKSQSPFNTCWAFAAVAAAESNMLRKGYGIYDFSEYQLAYFTYNQAFDALGNTTGDSTRIVNGSNYLALGGTNLWTMFAMANWTGLVDENSAPYGLAAPNSALSDSLAYKDLVHMQQCRMISMTNSQDVKQAIMDYGSVVSAINFDSVFFNPNTSALNYNKTLCNHAITIIGWDDNYNRTNFVTGHQPSSNGAWLVKNSWGNDNYPYMWVSYEDVAISNQDAYAYSFELSDNYDNNYQYDGAYGTYSYGIYNGESVANCFTVKAGKTEQLRAVSIALYDDNINYSIQIYKNSSTSDPRSGQSMLSTPVTGTTTYAGYYTIDLNQDISLNYGDTFSVVFTLKDMDAGDNSVDLFIDRSYSSSNGVKFISNTEKNQSYLIDESNHVYDFKENSSNGICPRIKAFTETVTKLDNQKTEDSKQNDSSSDITDIEEATQAMYRLYNPNSGEHFYTAVMEEKDYLVKAGWNYEGIAWYAPVTGNPVYRLYNPNAGDHHYTTSAGEKDYLVNVGWNYEGIAWCSGGSTPLYRAYNPNAIAGAHHYTTSRTEIDYLIGVGWKDEGLGWYGIK